MVNCYSMINIYLASYSCSCIYIYIYQYIYIVLIVYTNYIIRHEDTILYLD